MNDQIPIHMSWMNWISEEILDRELNSWFYVYQLVDDYDIFIDFKVGKEHETPDGIDYGEIVAFIYNFNILIQMIKNVRGTRNFGC